MTASAPTPDTLLKLCAASEPAPWYPSVYAQEAGLHRDRLDEPLNELRLAGLIRIGGWEAGKGQSYVLTDAGRAAMADGKIRRAEAFRRRAAEGNRQAETPRPPGRMTAWDRGEAVRTALLAPGGAPVTWTLLVLLILVFVGGYVLAAERGVTLSQYLANGRSPVMNRFEVSAAEVSRGEWWRLLTYSLAHGGAMHIVMNGIALMALGPFLEKALGPVRYLVLWVLGAFGGGVAVVLMSPGAAIGASGALCGLMAAAVAFIWLNRKHLGQRASREALRGLSTGILLTTLISFSPGISGAGHLGGAIAGLVAGVLLTYHRFGTAEQRWASLLGILLLPVAGVAPLFEKGILHWPRQQVARGEFVRPPVADEWANFCTKVGKPTEEVRILFEKCRENFIDSLRYQQPEKRDPTRVAAARLLLTNLHNEQEKARKLVEEAGPYQSPFYEPARKAAKEYLVAAEAVVVAMDACFVRGPKWRISADPNEKGETDELRLQQLFNDALEAELRWRHLAAQVVKAYEPRKKADSLNAVRREPLAPAGASHRQSRRAPR